MNLQREQEELKKLEGSGQFSGMIENDAMLHDFIAKVKAQATTDGRREAYIDVQREMNKVEPQIAGQLKWHVEDRIKELEKP